MTSRSARGLLMALSVLIGHGCSTAGAPIPSPTPSPMPAAASYDDFAVGLCSAMQALFRAVGNPDTGVGSDLSDALERAASDRDPAGAEKAAALIVSELQIGRAQAAHIAGWPPAERVGQNLDRLLLAFAAWTAAAVEEARGTAGADRQRAFEEAGGLDAWTGMLQGVQEAISQRPDGAPRECSGVPMDL